MKKSLKTITATAAACAMLMGAAASAAPTTSGGSGTDYHYYWCQDFDTAPESGKVAMRKSNSNHERAQVKDEDYAYKVTATGDSGYAIIDTNTNGGTVEKPIPKFDFLKGPIVLSFDITMNNKTSVADVMLRSGNGAADMLGILRISNTGRVCGFINKSGMEYASKASELLWQASNTIATVGTTYHIKAEMDYDKTNNMLTVRQYLNGNQMTLMNTQTPIEYKFRIDDMDTVLSGDMFLRFRIATKGGIYTLDNIAVYSIGEFDFDFDRDAYIGANAKSAAVTIKNAFDSKQKLISGAQTKISIPMGVKGIGNQYYTITKYDSADNPLLLKKGTEVTSNVAWIGNNGITIGSLDINKDSEFFILKLKDKSLIKAHNGQEIANEYTCLRRASLGKGQIAARETFIYDKDGNEITLDSDGKLPLNAAQIKFITAPQLTLTEDDVKMVGDNGDVFKGVQSEEEPNVWTIDTSNAAASTQYKITLGDFSQMVSAPADEELSFEVKSEYRYEEPAAEGVDTASFNFVAEPAMPEGQEAEEYGFRFVNVGVTDKSIGISNTAETKPLEQGSSFYYVIENVNITGAERVGFYAIPWVRSGDRIYNGSPFTYNGALSKNVGEVIEGTKIY